MPYVPPPTVPLLRESLTTCFLAGSGLAAWRGKQLFAPVASWTRGRQVGLVLAVVTAAVLRFAVAPFAPMHFVQHEAASAAAEPSYSMWISPRDASVTVFTRMLFDVLPGEPRVEPLFVAMAVLGVLAVPLVAVLVARLAKNPDAALGAAWLLALSAAPVRFASGGHPVTLLATTLAAALACLSAAAETRDRLLLAAGGLLTVFATLTHGEARVGVIPAAFVLFGGVPWRAWKQDRLWIPALAVLVVGLPVLMTLTNSGDYQWQQQ